MYWMDFTEDSVFSLNFDVGKTWSQALARRIEFGQITHLSGPQFPHMISGSE